MKVYALIGKSGSGKSYRAQYVARDYDIEYIIDDGLLIKGNKVIAGFSAKKEDTTIGAVKRAIFLDPVHRKNVADAIKNYNSQSILIIGTSDNMIEKIIDALGLPPVSKKIYIEDIASPKEIETAARIRKEQGKHIIPVPTFAVKKHFSGYFIDSIKNFTKRNRGYEVEDFEKTVVRPTFSYLGKYTISNSTLCSMISYAASKIHGIHRILRVSVENREEGIKIDIDVSVDYGFIIYKVVNDLKHYVKREIEYMTNLNILEINVFVKSINLDKNQR